MKLLSGSPRNFIKNSKPWVQSAWAGWSGPFFSKSLVRLLVSGAYWQAVYKFINTLKPARSTHKSRWPLHFSQSPKWWKSSALRLERWRSSPKVATMRWRWSWPLKRTRRMSSASAITVTHWCSHRSWTAAWLSCWPNTSTRQLRLDSPWQLKWLLSQ